MLRTTRRMFLQGAAAAALIAMLPHRLRASPAYLDDASGLNRTRVHRHWTIEDRRTDAFIGALRQELKDAAAAGRPVVASAARHSLGGQSLAEGGTAITLANPAVELDRAAGLCRVTAGARWFEVIAALDPKGFSPAVMQSNADFGVASTFSVNAHGWPVPYGPFGSTVRSLRMILADGTLLTCSREKNAELFGLAMGGYGLFGIILDLDIKVVANRLLAPAIRRLRGEDFSRAFMAEVTDPAVTMAYGRLEVARKTFFREALVVSYRARPTPDEGLEPVKDGGVMSFLSRKVYRAQIGSERAKRLRWRMETRIGPRVSSGVATRNTLMAEPVSNLAGGRKSRTDILHEYFIPPENFAAFIKSCRKIIPRSPLEFLNVTLRYVAPDQDSVLAYAPDERIGAVMSFSQQRNPVDEREMQRVTRALIDAAHAAGGSVYLPYRLHATHEQISAMYPKVDHFVARKRYYDPDLRFRNALWEIYLAER